MLVFLFIKKLCINLDLFIFFLTAYVKQKLLIFILIKVGRIGSSAGCVKESIVCDGLSTIPRKAEGSRNG